MESNQTDIHLYQSESLTRNENQTRVKLYRVGIAACPPGREAGELVFYCRGADSPVHLVFKLPLTADMEKPMSRALARPAARWASNWGRTGYVTLVAFVLAVLGPSQCWTSKQITGVRSSRWRFFLCLVAALRRCQSPGGLRL